MAASSTSDLCYATATDVARRIHDREISSTEVTEAFLTRIAAHNGKLNAIVQLFEGDARSRAKEADEALARLTRRSHDKGAFLFPRVHAGSW
jgi:amidase